MSELDEAMDAIPNLTEEQIDLLIAYQLQELAKYGEKGTRVAKKDQSEEDVTLALEQIVQLQATQPVQPAGKFKRRF